MINISNDLVLRVYSFEMEICIGTSYYKNARPGPNAGKADMRAEWMIRITRYEAGGGYSLTINQMYTRDETKIMM
jgi:hypothetical protein